MHCSQIMCHSEASYDIAVHVFSLCFVIPWRCHETREIQNGEDSDKIESRDVNLELKDPSLVDEKDIRRIIKMLRPP